MRQIINGGERWVHISDYERLEKALEIVQFELSPGPDAARSLAARVRVARRALDRLPLIGSPASGEAGE
jgi:hypothetical protein